MPVVVALAGWDFLELLLIWSCRLQAVGSRTDALHLGSAVVRPPSLLSREVLEV